MTVRIVETSAPTVDRSIKVSYDFGDNLREMVNLFGDRIVFEHAVDNMVIALQGHCRARLKREGDDYMSDVSIKNSVKNWKPGGRVVDPAKRIARMDRDIEKLDDRAAKKLLEKLQRRLVKKIPTPKNVEAAHVEPEPIVESDAATSAE